MYKKGDYVVKIPEGVCKIEDIGPLNISGTNKEYYMLVPINEKASKIYIPADTIEGRIRNVISKEDAMKFINSIPDINEKNISNEKLREQEYKAAILSINFFVVYLLLLNHIKCNIYFFIYNRNIHTIWIRTLPV